MALKGKLYVILSLLATLVSMVGCGSSGCYENRSSIPTARLYAYNNPTQTITADSLSLYGIGQPSGELLLDCARRVSAMTMPLRNDADTTQFVIRYDAKAFSLSRYNDTLTWIYRRYPYFISGDCGVVFNYAIDTLYYTRNMLDSVAVMVDEVTNQDQETIRLYYYVAND